MGTRKPDPFLLKSFVVCCTGISFHQRTKLKEIVEKFGGTWSSDLTNKVTHLIAAKMEGTEKLKMALKLSLPILLPAFLVQLDDGNAGCVSSRDIRQRQEEHLTQTLSNITICVSGLSLELRNTIKRLVLENGGVYSHDLTQKCDYLLTEKASISQTESQNHLKIQYAKEWGIKIMDFQWLMESINAKCLLEDSSYILLEHRKKKTNNVAEYGQAVDSNISQEAVIVGVFQNLNMLVDESLEVKMSEIEKRVVENAGNIVENHHVRPDYIISNWLLDAVRYPECSYVTDCWVEKCIEHNKVCEKDNEDHIFFQPIVKNEVGFGVFSRLVYGLEVSVSGCSKAEEDHISCLLNECNSRLSVCLTKKVDVLLCQTEQEDYRNKPKFVFSEKWNIPIINIKWIVYVLKGMDVSYEEYVLSSGHADTHVIFQRFKSLQKASEVTQQSKQTSKVVNKKRSVRACKNTTTPPKSLFQKSLLTALYNKRVSIHDKMRILGREAVSEMNDSIPPLFKGFFLCLSKKLFYYKDDLVSIIEKLGGRYTWNWCDTCTHFIHEGTRRSESMKEIRNSRSMNKFVVSPWWITGSFEKKILLNELEFPYTYDPTKTLEFYCPEDDTDMDNNNNEVSLSHGGERSRFSDLIEKVMKKNKTKEVETIGKKPECLRLDCGIYEGVQEDDRMIYYDTDITDKNILENLPRKGNKSEIVEENDVNTGNNQEVLVQNDTNTKESTLESGMNLEEDLKSTDVSATNFGSTFDPLFCSNVSEITSSIPNRSNNQSVSVGLFLFSNINPGKLKTLIRCIEKTNKLSNKEFRTTTSVHWVEECTHLVIGSPKRSEKYFAALASGKKIVKPEYITHSFKHKRWIDEDKFHWDKSLFRDNNRYPMKKDNEKHNNPKISEITSTFPRTTSQDHLFESWNVILDVSQMKSDGLGRVLKAGGATVTMFSNEIASHSNAFFLK